MRVVAAGIMGLALACTAAPLDRAASMPLEPHGKEHTVNGLKTIASALGPKDTMDRLEAGVRARGMTVFARIDHAAGAAQVNLPLRPTEVLIFGSPLAGTRLMDAHQTMGIDLPLKALVWEDDSGRTWLSYDDPRWLVARHGDPEPLKAILLQMQSVLEAVSSAAVERQ